MSISVIIPCYNQGHFLAEAIESVLAQEISDLEIVVVNDGSTDSTGDIANGYDQVTNVEQDNQGLSQARNNGFKASSGQFIVFLDSDDRLPEGALKHNLEAFSQNPDAAMVYGRLFRLLDGQVKSSRPEPPFRENYYRDLLKRNYIPTPGMAMFKRATLERFGLFNPTLSESADYDIYLRIARKAPIVSHPHAAVERRIHEDNMSGDAYRMLLITLKVHKSQKKFAKRDPALLSAYREGETNWRRFYGDRLINQFWESIDRRDFGKAFNQSVALLRHCPKRVWLRMRRAQGETLQ